MQIRPIFLVPFYRAHVEEHSEISKLISLKKIHDLTIYPAPWKCNVLTSINPVKSESDPSTQWCDDFYSICSKYVKEFIKLIHNDLNHVNISFHDSWINLYHKHSFQEWHCHIGPRVMYSFCYFYKLPKDENRGTLLFRSRIMDFEQYFPQHLQTQKIFQPNEQQHELFIFPCWMEHMVTQHNCREERITISGNFYFS